MALIKTDQFHHENMTWERMIEFFKQENSFLKNRLAQVLDHDGPVVEAFIALAEQFQNQFILKDEFFDELRHDIHDQQKKLAQAGKENNTEMNKKIIKQQEKLRNEMAWLEKDFTRLKNEFNNYLLKVL
jgi:seryl-tRNA synthetase